MARLKLTAQLQEEICGYIAAGITKRGAAAAVGIDESSFFIWMQKAEEAIRESKSGKNDLIYINFFKAVKKAETAFKLTHIKNIKNAADEGQWQGTQAAMFGFDELTHFSKSQFFYMLSRNRSDSGVKGYIRATCNPDADSWVADFISWWIDHETGYPIPERSGQIRWMYRNNDEIYWADTRKLEQRHCQRNG